MKTMWKSIYPKTFSLHCVVWVFIAVAAADETEAVSVIKPSISGKFLYYSNI